MDILQRHLDGLRLAQARARERGAVDAVERYEQEIARVEQLIAAGGVSEPTPEGTVPDEEYAPDSLLALVLRAGPWWVQDPSGKWRMRRGLPVSDDPDAPATLALPPLPPLVTRVTDVRRALRARIDEYARQVAARWRLWGADEKALTALSGAEHGPQREQWRRWLAWRGVCLALARAKDPQPAPRIGKGKGSGKPRDAKGKVVEKFVPIDHDILAFLAWLAQEAPKEARALLRELTAGEEPPESDRLFVPWPVDDLPDRDATPLDEEVLDRLEPEEDDS